MEGIPRISKTLALVLCLSLSSIPLVTTHAQNGTNPQIGINPQTGANPGTTHSKASPEIRSLMADVSRRDQRTTVILQLKSGIGASLQIKLADPDSVVRAQLNELRITIVEVSNRRLSALVYDDSVAFVAPDRDIKLLSHLTTTTGTENIRRGTKPDGITYSVDGTGIGIAVLDSGIDTAHVAFKTATGKRIAFSKDFTGVGTTKDSYGHGTHVAGEISGDLSYPTLNYTGVAPGASLINLRVLDDQGFGKESAVLNALDWVLTNRTTYNIRVVNMSLGSAAIDSYTDDPMCKAVRKLVDAGVVVVAAAGNNGKDAMGRKVYGSIHSPGNEPSALTVGASNSFQTDKRSDDGVASYSSRGPTRSYWVDGFGNKNFDNIRKPELVAPGNKIVSAQADKNYLVTMYPYLAMPLSSDMNNKAMSMSGTSMAAPVVAGAAALLLQENPNLTPNMVKIILMYTAQKLPYANEFEQGAGELNIDGALKLARLVRKDLTNQTPAGTPMLTSAVSSTTSSIAGEKFTWAKKAFFGTYSVTGSDLVNDYQRVYGLGMVLSDGIILSDGVIMSDRNLLSDGLIMGDGIIISDGIILSDGIIISDGIILGDGFVIGDGFVLGDGIILSDHYLAESIVVNGDFR